MSGAGFSRDYEKTDDFGHVVRMICALPFAPPDQLDQVLYLHCHCRHHHHHHPYRHHYERLSIDIFTSFSDTNSFQFVSYLVQVFELLRSKATQLKSAAHREFSIGLVDYAEKQWRDGDFVTQVLQAKHHEISNLKYQNTIKNIKSAPQPRGHSG